MADDSLKWFRAAQLLDIPEAERGRGWPVCFSAYELAILHAPEDKEEQEIIRGAIEYSLTSSISRNPERRDIGREPDIDERAELAARFAPELNSPQIKLYDAKMLSDWFKDNTENPSTMLAAWFKAMRVDVVTWSGTIESLEPLTEEQKQTYNSRTSWTWVDAIYILQGYKPVYQLSTEQVRSHFPQQVHDFTDSIELGSVGKLRERAGERTHIDSPANWQAYWQGISKQTETVASVGVGSKTKKPIKEKELKQWLRETWISEGRLGGTAFFTSLKKYVNTKGSPILEHYTAGKCAGFRWETSTTTRGEMRKKTILNIVAAFKNTP